MIDFSFPPEVDAVRLKVRDFIDTVVRPVEQSSDSFDRDAWVKGLGADGQRLAAIVRAHR